MWKRNKLRQPSMLSIKIAGVLEIIQNRWVAYMQKWEADWSLRRKKLYLGLFVTFATICFILIFLSGIHVIKSPQYSAITISPIRAPIVQPHQVHVSGLSKEDSLNIRFFLHVIDSLQATPEGRQQLDHFYREHPGIKDSIEWIKKLFHR